MSLNFEFGDQGTVIIEGVWFSIDVIKECLNKPAPGIYSFKRVNNHIEVTRHHNLEACERYFKATEQKEPIKE